MPLFLQLYLFTLLYLWYNTLSYTLKHFNTSSSVSRSLSLSHSHTHAHTYTFTHACTHVHEHTHTFTHMLTHSTQWDSLFTNTTEQTSLSVGRYVCPWPLCCSYDLPFPSYFYFTSVVRLIEFPVNVL